MNKKTVATNKKALFDYEVLEDFEAGITLIGSEVKSVKASHIQLKGSYISIRDNEAFLVGAYISPFKQGEKFDESRARKLLLKRSEIDRMIGKSKEAGIAIIPIEVYLKRGLVKLKIAIARGKKKYDKRELQKKRETERTLRRKFKNIKI